MYGNSRLPAHRRPQRIWVAATLTVILATAGLPPTAAADTGPSPAHHAAAAPHHAVPNGATPAELSASTQAITTGSPVVIDEMTTESSQVTAQPDGTFELSSSAQPVRVHHPDGWVPVDTTLTTTSSGTLAPKAADIDVQFSGGGTSPLITLRHGTDQTLTISWPTRLPTPTLAADTATYPDVFPGVDLVVSAQPAGYTQTLVITTAQAADNPALTALTYNIATTNLTLTHDAHGALSATDTDGTPVFAGAPPTMWDSTTDPQIGPTPSPTDPGSGKTTTLAITTAKPQTQSTQSSQPTGTTQSSITLNPPTSALTGAGVHYPVYIDPQMSNTQYQEMTVQSNGATTWNPSTTDGLRVGYCDTSQAPSCNNIGVLRGYFTINTSPITRAASWQTTVAHVFTASVTITQYHTAFACDNQPTELTATNAGISPSTTWPGPASSTLSTISSNKSDNCSTSPPGYVTFPTSTTMVNYLQIAATNNIPGTTYGLKAADETTFHQWKRFGTDATLTATFNFPPSVPVATGIDGAFTCAGTTYLPGTTATVHGKAHDNNYTPQNVLLTYKLYKTGTSSPQATSPAISTPSDTTGSWTKTSMTDGQWYYQVNAKTSETATQLSAAADSPAYNFTVVTTGPSTTPTIKSFTYPSQAWGLPMGMGGTFQLGSGGATITAFAYGWDSAANITTPNNTDCTYNKTTTTGGWITATSNTATLQPTSLTPGPHTLYVRTFNSAHLMSTATATYQFYVAPTYSGPTLTNMFTEGEGHTASPSSGSYTFDETVNSNWSQSKQLHFVATSGNPATGPTITLPITTDIEADYALGIGLTKSHNYGTLSFTIDDHPIIDNNTGDPLTIDTYNSTPTTSFLNLGGLHLTTGTHQLTIRVIGKNPASTGLTYTGIPGIPNGTNDNGYAAGIDYYTTIPLTNATTTNLQAAFNNNGISPDNTAGNTANYGPDTTGRSLSETTLHAIGLDPGTPTTIDGVSFTRPAPLSNGNDNVIATGQTIPITPATGATNIDVLAFETCGNSPADGKLAFTITYTDPVSSDNGIPSVPDVLATPPTGPITVGTQSTLTTAATLPHLNIGSSATPSTPGQYLPTLYHLQLPIAFASAGYQAAGLTLPNQGSDLTNNCKHSLHILAISSS